MGFNRGVAAVPGCAGWWGGSDTLIGETNPPISGFDKSVLASSWMLHFIGHVVGEHTFRR